jgi:hypothetical protein
MPFVVKWQVAPNTGILSQDECGSVKQALDRACQQLKSKSGRVWIERGGVIWKDYEELERLCGNGGEALPPP